MKILFALLTLVVYSYASNLLTYNVYERSDRVDIMLSFDAPHEGSIAQKNDASSITLTINDLSYDRLIEKSINSAIIQELSIVPEKNNSIKIILKSDKQISVIASKTVDGFGLRIRGSIMQSPAQRAATTQPSSATTLGDATSDILDMRYILVVCVLIVLLLVMFWIRKRVASGSGVKNSGGKSWLFNPKTGNTQEVTLLHKKPIDNNNSVVLFEYGSIRYLVMTGNSNVLLEKFENGEVKDNSEFEKVFEENRRKLDDYLKLQDTKLNTYKNKASADYSSYETH
ncbi:MAG: hypothetical protein PHR87_09710 [Sulfurospirillaceae bacterium]|nr:hypothetical protein [Sulfurospirillaceae bacterium]